MQKANNVNKSSVVIDDGTREIRLVNKFGKEICKIHIRPADFSIIDRYNAMMMDFDTLIEPLKALSLSNDGTVEFEQDWQTLKMVENTLKDRINELFDMDEADAIFAKRNPFSSINGTFYCVQVLNALQQMVAEAVEEEAKKSEQRMSKYLDDIEPTPATEGTEDAGAVAEKP